MTVRDVYLKWRVIHLTGRDIYFDKGHNFVTNYQGDEILFMCTNPNLRGMINKTELLTQN